MNPTNGLTGTTLRCSCAAVDLEVLEVKESCILDLVSISLSELKSSTSIGFEREEERGGDGSVSTGFENGLLSVAEANRDLSELPVP